MLSRDTLVKARVAAGAAVDAHFHVFAAGARAGAAPRYVPSYDAPLADWERAAAAHGIGLGVVVQPSFLGTDNAALLAALEAMPQRLRGVAVLEPDTSDHSLARLDALGVRGVRLNFVGLDHVVDGANLRLIERVGAIGWHVELHTDRGALAALLPQLPDNVPLVIDHFGKPEGVNDDAMWRAVRRRASRMHVKLSAPYRLGGIDPALLAARWCAELGSEKLLWGSDWPCTNHESAQRDAHSLEQLCAWLPEETDVRRVLVENPRRLYRF